MYRLDDISIVHDGTVTVGYCVMIWHYNHEFSSRDLNTDRVITIVDLDTNEKSMILLQQFCELLKSGLIFCQKTIGDMIHVPVITDIGYQLSRNLEFVGISKSFEEVNPEILSPEFSSEDISHLIKMISAGICYNYTINYSLGIYDCIATGNMPYDDAIRCRHGYIIGSDEEMIVHCNIYDFMLREKGNVLFLSDGTLGVVTLCVNSSLGDLCVVKFRYSSRILLEFM